MSADHTAAARKARQRARQLKEKLVRVEVSVYDGQQDTIREVAAELRREHDK